MSSAASHHLLRAVVIASAILNYVAVPKHDMQLNFILLQDKNLAPLGKSSKKPKKYSHHKYNDHTVTYRIPIKKLKHHRFISHTHSHPTAHTTLHP